MSQARLQQLRAAAKSLRAAGDPAAALAAAEAAAKASNGAATDLLTLAGCLAAAGGPREADVILKEITDRWPAYAPARLQLAKSLAARGDAKAAAKEAEAAYELGGRKPAAAIALARLLAKDGDLEGARIAFENAIAADKTLAPAHIGLAQTLAELGLFKPGLKAIDDALRIAPDHAGALRMRARLLAKGGGEPSAIGAAYAAAIAAAPAAPALALEQAEALKAAGDRKGEVEALQTAAAASESPLQRLRIATRAAGAHLALDDLPSARDEARLALAAAADCRNGQNPVQALEGLMRQAAAAPAPDAPSPVERAIVRAVKGRRDPERDASWAETRLAFGRLAAPFALRQTLAEEDAPDPWDGLVDETELLDFAREFRDRPALLVGGHFGPLLAAQDRLYRNAPDVICLATLSPYWLTRNDRTRLIPAGDPNRATLNIFDRLREGASVYIGADGDLGDRTLMGRVLGLSTSWPCGAADLSRLAGAELFGCAAVWDGPRIKVVVERGPDPAAVSNLDAWRVVFADWYGKWIEKLLIEDPANFRPGASQYFGLKSETSIWKQIGAQS